MVPVKIKHRSPLRKKARRGFRGSPAATVAFYGPDDRRATRVAVGIVAAEGSGPSALERRHSDDDVAWDGLTDAARRSLQETTAELQARASTRHFLFPDRASLLEQQLRSFGPHDEVAAIAVHPDGVEFGSLVRQVLEFCRIRKPTALCAVADAFINSWDDHAEQVWTSPE